MDHAGVNSLDSGKLPNDMRGCPRRARECEREAQNRLLLRFKFYRSVPCMEHDGDACQRRPTYPHPLLGEPVGALFLAVVYVLVTVAFV